MNRRRLTMILGFVAAAVGDWHMAGPGHSFVGGVVAFTVAQLVWMEANLKETHVDFRSAVALAFPLAALFAWRIFPAVAADRFSLMCGYAVVSLAALAVASGTRRFWYALGIALLMVSDVCIALRMAHVPHWHWGVGPLYLAALACLLTSTVRGDGERRMKVRAGTGSPWLAGALGLVAAGCFVAAIAVCPEPYNPCCRMLSRLGRTVLDKVDYPLCHYLFTFGMFAAAAAIWRTLAGWGGAICAAGLLTIAAVPENVDMNGHNAGCWLAAIGGIVAVVPRSKGRRGRIVAGLLMAVLLALGVCIGLHALKAIPFAPAVPTLQKVLILSFAAWVVGIANVRSGK